MKVLITFIVLFNLFAITELSYAVKDVPFTLDDRDRIIRVEAKVDAIDRRIDALDKRIDGLDKRIDSLDKRIDGLQNLIQIVIGGIIALIGFVLWDRRSALSPAIRKNKELEEREEKIERALRELATKDSRIAEVLKQVGLL